MIFSSGIQAHPFPNRKQQSYIVRVFDCSVIQFLCHYFPSPPSGINRHPTQCGCKIIWEFFSSITSSFFFFYAPAHCCQMQFSRCSHFQRSNYFFASFSNRVHFPRQTVGTCGGCHENLASYNLDRASSAAEKKSGVEFSSFAFVVSSTGVFRGCWPLDCFHKSSVGRTWFAT